MRKWSFWMEHGKKKSTAGMNSIGNNLLNQEAVLEGAVHSIRNMGDVAFVILRRREGLFQTVLENEMANVSIHDLKEGNDDQGKRNSA